MTINIIPVILLYLAYFCIINAKTSAAIINNVMNIKINNVLDKDCLVLYDVKYTYDNNEYAEL